MDFGTFYGLLTVAGLLAFLAIAAWAFSEATRKGFEDAALIPFQEKDLPSPMAGSWLRHY